MLQKILAKTLPCINSATPATVRFHAQKAQFVGIADSVIERYTAEACELATLRAIDPLNPRIAEILFDNPWIDDDFPAHCFEPEHDELYADCEPSNRFEGVVL